MPKNSPAKARALRIPLEFYAKDRLALYRNVLTIVAVLAVVGWILSGHFRKNAIANRYSPGGISGVHSRLGCDACHKAGAPLRDSTFLSGWSVSETDKAKLWHRPSDQMCQSCHRVEGSDLQIAKNAAIENFVLISPHSNNQKNQDVDSCASCHSEHDGLDHHPSAVADSQCVDCHQQIEKHWLTPHNEFTKTVTDFATDHPAFRSLKQDQGTLKFSHALHMSVGIREPDARSSMTKTLDDYPDKNGELAGFVNARGQITLGANNCKFCHQPNEKRLSGNKSIESMTMPSYEQNCQVCHSIDLLMKVEGNRKNILQVEHGADIALIEKSIRDQLSGQSFANQDNANQEPNRPWDIKNPDAKDKLAIDEEVKNSISKIRNSCLLCHLPSDLDSDGGLLDIKKLIDNEAPEKDDEVVESAWFKNAVFDHANHRDVNCAHCHLNTGGKGDLIKTGQPISNDRPMIKNKDSCVQCHQPPSKVQGDLRPGPVNCMACHTYHGGGNRAAKTIIANKP